MNRMIPFRTLKYKHHCYMDINPQDVLGLVHAMDRVRDYSDTTGINNMWKAHAAFLHKYPHLAHDSTVISTLPFPDQRHDSSFFQPHAGCYDDGKHLRVTRDS